MRKLTNLEDRVNRLIPVEDLKAVERKRNDWIASQLSPDEQVSLARIIKAVEESDTTDFEAWLAARPEDEQAVYRKTMQLDQESRKLFTMIGEMKE